MKRFRITYENIQTIVSEVEGEDKWEACNNIKLGEIISEEIISQDFSDEGLWEIEGVSSGYSEEDDYEDEDEDEDEDENN